MLTGGGGTARIARLAWRTEPRLRYVDVWRSKDDHGTFAGNRLHPILPEMPGFAPPALADTGLDGIDAWTGRHPG